MFHVAFNRLCHPEVAIDLNNLAQLPQATNHLFEAEPLMRRNVENLHNFGEATGHEHRHMEVASEKYRSLLVEIGLSPEEALERLRTVLSISGR